MYSLLSHYGNPVHGQRLIYSEVQKLIQNEDEAEDLMQTVVEKLIHKVDLLRDLERRRLVNYVISTAKNTAQNFLRNTRPQARVWEAQEQLADPAPMPEEEILHREDLSAYQGFGPLWMKRRGISSAPDIF